MERKRQAKAKRKASQTSSLVGEHCVRGKRIVLVGTYKRKLNQLKWIGKRHLYNYPLSEEEAKVDNGAWNNVKELWLYSGTTDRRHIYTAEFLGVKPRKEFLAEHPDYPKDKGKGHGDYYVVFSVRYKYQPTIDDSVVVVRASDFKRTPKVIQAVKRIRRVANLAAFLTISPQNSPRSPMISSASVKQRYSWISCPCY